MNIILPHAHHDQVHLDSVIAEMAILGAPTISAVDCGEYYVALEGAHRLRAAKALGLEPIIRVIDYSEEMTTDEVVPGSYQDNYTIAEIVDGSHGSVMISI